MKVLFIGDIVGRLGRTVIKALLPPVVSRYKIDFVIANGENSAAGFGITESVAEEIFNCGVHVITTGNHVWDKKESLPFLSKEHRVLRPLNYPPGVPGYGSVLVTINGTKIAVMNIQGRVFMTSIDCPFRTGMAEIERVRSETACIIVDFHAEATSEKIAFGYYVDGKVSAVLGTHTHVQTADEKILPGGTAYITDVGMTGPAVSVIGIEKEQIIERFLHQMPMKFEIGKGAGIFSAVALEIEDKTGKTLAIQRLQLTHP
ncbi:MAG TPA: TIGR00282 family metallophosphoesterase [Thermodesulfovibrionales bacterium]|nr:TIGR00282 family metallophosphoesterase [Thermodesulfovibrionales bacterium]